MNCDDLQKFLPPTWTVQREVPDAAAFGQVFEVLLLLEGQPIGAPGLKRLLQVMPRSRREDPERPALVERVTALAGAPIPHLICPDQVGVLPCGSIYILYASQGDALSARIQDMKGIPPSQADELAEQALIALAALHHRNIVHGDLQAKNTRMAVTNGQPEACWLDAAATGWTTYWSKGDLRDPDAEHYWPPEWEGETKPPSSHADLYALGLVLCETLLGWQGNPNRSIGEDRDLSLKQTLTKLKQRGAAKPLRRLISLLLRDDPNERPTALTALRIFHRSKQHHAKFLWRAMAATFAAGLIVLLIACSWALREKHALAEENRDLKGKVTALDGSLRSTSEKSTKLDADLTGANQLVEHMKADNGRLQDDVGKLKNEVETLRRQLAGGPAEPSRPSAARYGLAGHPPPPPPPEQQSDVDSLAKDVWRKSVPPASNQDRSLEKALQEALKAVEAQQSLVKQLPNDKKKREEKAVFDRLNEWYVLCQGLRLETKEWLNGEQSSEDNAENEALVWDVVLEPWNVSKHAKLKATFAVLTAASTKWQGWAASEMTFDQLSDDTQSIADADIKLLLNKWLSSYRTKGSWRLQPVKGTAPKEPDLGTARLLTIYTGQAADVAAGDLDHVWEKSALDRYPAKVQIAFNWKAGDPIRVLLEGQKGISSGYLARPDLIEATFKGPLAMWRLQQAGQISGAETGVALQYHVEDCPGPPRTIPKWPTKPAVTIQQKPSRPKAVDVAPSKSPVKGSIKKDEKEG